MTNPVSFYGKMLSFSRLQLQSNDEATLAQALQKLINKKTNTLIPVVIDSNISQNLPSLLKLLRDNGLQPIGVLDGKLTQQAKTHHLAIFPADNKPLQRIEPSQSVNTKGNTRIHDMVVRSGQSINHVGGDLILTNGLNAGGEAITSDSLHIYGAGYGRLVAGASGDTNARIFCQRFKPTLVSIAGTFCLQESIPAEMLDKAVQVHYAEDKGLVFTLMNPEIK